MSEKFLPANAYVTLIAAIDTRMRSGLIAAQKALEYQRLKTYWNIGKIINAYLAKNPEADNNGRAFFKKLSDDLNREGGLMVSHDTLSRAARFHKQYPKFPAKTPLTFSHYLVLMRVADPRQRARLEHRAIDEGVSVIDMKREVALLRRACVRDSGAPPAARLAVKRGEPFVYALKVEADINGNRVVRVDCGFKILKSLPESMRHMTGGGRIVRAAKEGSNYTLTQNQKLRDGRYTYPAVVTRVIDGDTIDACVDVGFGIWINDRFRLKGINTPELGTPPGERAKIFLEHLLAQCPRIIIRSFKEGMYGRWLADVFALKGSDDPHAIARQGDYVNQVLIDEGLAQEY